MFKRADAILVILLLIVTLSFNFILTALRHPSGDYAIISIGENVYQNIDLSYDRLYSIDNTGFFVEVEVMNGAIRILSSDCPDKSCVRQGFISASGNSRVIVCLPNKLVIRIQDTKTDKEIDAIAY